MSQNAFLVRLHSLVRGSQARVKRMEDSFPKRLFLPSRGVGSSAPSDACPFDITVSPNGSNFDVSLRPGTVNQMIPSNLFTPITVSGVASSFVKLHCTTNGTGVTGVTVTADATPSSPIIPTPSVGSTTFDILIGVILPGGTSIKTLGYCASIRATLSQVFTQDKSDPPAPGISPYIRWYTWITEADS